MTATQSVRLLAVVLVPGVLLTLDPGEGRPSADSRPEPVAADGLHNVYRLSDGLYSGSGPEGDAGFAALRRLGVRTVLSVDGAAPDTAMAARYGLRYVHVPMGYDGVPEEKAYRMARAVRDLPGPVYVHCHHGKHRGPAAAAAIRLCLDPTFTPDDAADWLKLAGTDPRYKGLVGLPETFRRPTSQDLDRVPADFPPVAAVADLTRLMVAVDERWDRLKEVKAAGWMAPPVHPDVDPAHEALQLVEHYRESARLSDARKRGEEFLAMMQDAESAAGELEAALRAKLVNAEAAGKAFTRSQAACARCHGRFRD